MYIHFHMNFTHLFIITTSLYITSSPLSFFHCVFSSRISQLYLYPTLFSLWARPLLGRLKKKKQEGNKKERKIHDLVDWYHFKFTTYIPQLGYFLQTIHSLFHSHREWEWFRTLSSPLLLAVHLSICSAKSPVGPHHRRLLTLITWPQQAQCRP